MTNTSKPVVPAALGIRHFQADRLPHFDNGSDFMTSKEPAHSNWGRSCQTECATRWREFQIVRGFRLRSSHSQNYRPSCLTRRSHTTQHRRTALHTRIGFDHRAKRPVNLLSHDETSRHHDFTRKAPPRFHRRRSSIISSCRSASNSVRGMCNSRSYPVPSATAGFASP